MIFSERKSQYKKILFQWKIERRIKRMLESIFVKVIRLKKDFILKFDKILGVILHTQEFTKQLS